jgi:sulfiredoxin
MAAAFQVPLLVGRPHHASHQPSISRRRPLSGTSTPPPPEQSRNIHLSRPRRPSATKKERLIPLRDIRRPLAGTRTNDSEKVARLAESIAREGLHEPIDVLEVDGVIYGFSGCHRFEAHQKLGLEKIRCRVYPATKNVLRRHLL